MTNSTNISFTSRINILSSKAFDKLPKGKHIGFDPNAITPTILKSDVFNTVNIRTCTGGGIKSENNKSALGFHLWDICEENDFTAQLNKIQNSFNSIDGGLIIGSKNVERAENSIKNFKIVKQTLQQKCGNISWFQTIRKALGEVDFIYSKADDTWNLRLCEWDCKNRKYKTVNTLKKFLEFFEEISISPKDRLYIGGKEITKANAPAIFRKQ